MTNEASKIVIVRVSEREQEFLRRKADASAYLRWLLQRAMMNESFVGELGGCGEKIIHFPERLGKVVRKRNAGDENGD